VRGRGRERKRKRKRKRERARRRARERATERARESEREIERESEREKERAEHLHAEFLSMSLGHVLRIVSAIEVLSRQRAFAASHVPPNYEVCAS
jgi:hypothetical protein